jgi:hypothetical protein
MLQIPFKTADKTNVDNLSNRLALLTYFNCKLMTFLSGKIKKLNTKIRYNGRESTVNRMLGGSTYPG